MKILGMSCYYHDSAAVLIRDGKIIAATEEERFSRIKHDSDFPKMAIEFCLEKGKIKTTDLDYVVFYEKPYIKFERILLQTLVTFPFSLNFFRQSMKEWLTKKLWIKQRLAEKLNVDLNKIYFCDHHVSHAASAFYPSSFKKAAILTLDGVGEWSVATYGTGENNKIKLVKELRFPHSLGLLYSAFTAFLGFEVNEGEYKVMGMAPYGRPRFANKIKKLVDIKEDGSFKLDMSYLTFHLSTRKSFNKKFEKLFGKPRDPKSLFYTEKTGFPKFWGEKPKDYEKKVKQNQNYADIAASIQAITEKIILKICNYVAKETGLTSLCIAGGVGLNGVANGKIINQTPFKNLFIQPAAGDSGGALGAALYFYHQILDEKKRYPLSHVYYGKSYSNSEIKKFLDNNKIKYQEFDDKKLIEEIASELMDKKVIGWFQGAFEWGPRALGNRSILADPRLAEMKNIVNSKIKFREPYRPFAPAVLEEKAKNFFEIADPKSGPAKFMNIVVPIKKGKDKVIPAVCHMYTSRLQTVNKKNNPKYYELIKKFGEKTGIPIVLNTSFNLRGEPIVNTPQEAYNTFIRSCIDILVMENCIIIK